MCGIPAKKSRDRLDNGLLIDVPEIASAAGIILATRSHVRYTASAGAEDRALLGSNPSAAPVQGQEAML